jgi:hypothetical protein
MAGTVTPILRALVTTVKVSRRGSSSFAHVADRLRLPVQPQDGWSILPSGVVYAFQSSLEGGAYIPPC